MKLNFTKAIAEAEKRVLTGKFPAWLSNLCIDSTADIEAIALVAFEEGRLQVLEQMAQQSISLAYRDEGWDLSHPNDVPVLNEQPAEGVVKYLDANS